MNRHLATERTGSRFLRRWVLAVTIAETVGFAIPAGVGVALSVAAAPTFVVYPLMILAGAGEGALLGLGQSIGFGRSVLPRAHWIGVTSLGAAVAWAIGMLPSIIGLNVVSPRALPFVALGAILLLASIPTLQWLVLRRVVHRSVWWIPVNAAVWAVGIVWTIAPSPLIDEHSPLSVIFVVYLAAGLLMALTVAVGTGLAARRVVHEHTAPQKNTERPTETTSMRNPSGTSSESIGGRQ